MLVGAYLSNNSGAVFAQNKKVGAANLNSTLEVARELDLLTRGVPPLGKRVRKEVVHVWSSTAFHATLVFSVSCFEP
jgi:hypothetical protein